jgi:prevent-host-death family protein
VKRLSVVQAKAQLSALLDAVERGEAVEITRRGVPVARLVQPERRKAPGFELATFLAEIRQQPLHAEADAGDLVRALRDGARS